MEQEVLQYSSEKGIIITKAAFEILKNSKRWKEILDYSLEKRNEIIDEEFIHNFVLRQDKIKIKEEIKVVRSGERERVAKERRDIESNFKILWEYDITGKIKSSGKIEDFNKFFKEKFEFLAEILRKRGFEGEISKVKKTKKTEQVVFVAMVSEKWKSKNGNLALRLEDFRNEVIGVISKTNKELFEDGENIVEDEVLAFEGNVLSEDMILISNFWKPDVLIGGVNKAENEVNCLFISDTHIGSKLFLDKVFEKMLNWINLNVGDKGDLNLAKKIKYVVFAGDMVDGIGIYPGQIDNLEIKDIFEQYRVFGDYIEKIPEEIEIFLAPGNHDAVRRADPQPALGKEFRQGMENLGNVHFIGSPSMLEIEGVKILPYHGHSIFGLIEKISFLKPTNPTKAMEEMMKRRDLFPCYGTKQPIVPEKRNYMLIKETPDIFVTGHIHYNEYATYRERLLINAGTWEDITPYQLMQGQLVVTPGRAVVVPLNKFEIKERKFLGE